jgi:signal transduction histidine kinase
MRRLFELNSIRSRMWSGFLFLTVLISLLLLGSLFMMQRLSAISATQSAINHLQVLTLHLIRIDNDFFDIGTLEVSYFESHNSSFLKRHDSLSVLIEKNIEQLKQSAENNNYPDRQLLEVIQADFEAYQLTFRELEGLLFERGFRDFGTEGKMRQNAHALEAMGAPIRLTDLLTLRRNEKDFLLRHDLQYRERFNQLANRLLNPPGGRRLPEPAFSLLTGYQLYFNRLTEIVVTIGLTSTDGLRSELNQLTARVSDAFDRLAIQSNNFATGERNRFLAYYIFMVMMAIVFMVGWGYWVSKRMSSPIARLSGLINRAMKNKKVFSVEWRPQTAAVEITTLTNNFLSLFRQTQDQLKVIREKSRQIKQRNRELRRLNQELDHFLYSTAHDLRSPLTSLAGLVRLAEIENTQPGMNLYFAMMRDSIARQEEFIRQIVAYTRNKKLDLQIEPVDLHELISKIVEDHKFMEGAGRIEISVSVRSKAPFHSDKSRLTILFNNLVSNAIRYADPAKEKPFVRVSVRVCAEEAYIEFADNGLGIDESHLKRIFDMFYRAHSGSKGSGLGLFIFKKTIQRLRGKVQVESKPGEGTKFIIRLPNELKKEPQLSIDLPTPAASAAGV